MPIDKKVEGGNTAMNKNKDVKQVVLKPGMTVEISATESNLIKKFVVCPNCQHPIRSIKEFESYMKEGPNYCGHCGTKIRSDLEEALRIVRELTDA